jgi:hypothetical protein
MLSISLQLLQVHRCQTFHLPPAAKIVDPAGALEFVNERGFVYFWPIKGVDMPSLWMTVAGDRPVADAHDDPGHVTWQWKDAALGKRIWYYAKILRRKATIVSLEIAPYFYALSDNYGSPEEDHLIAYQEGRLTLAAKQIYEALLKEGALNTLDLRRAAHMTNKGSDSEFNRALEVLQADFKILPIGVAEVGAWKYAFIYDIVPHHMPELPEKARAISEAQARQKLVELYFNSVGAAQLRDVVRLFGWSNEISQRVINKLVENGKLSMASHPIQTGDWLSLPQFLEKV